MNEDENSNESYLKGTLKTNSYLNFSIRVEDKIVEPISFVGALSFLTKNPIVRFLKKQ